MFGWISHWKQKHQKAKSIPNSQEPNTDTYEGPPRIISVSDTFTDEAEYRQHDRQYKDRQIRTNRLIIAVTVATAAGTIWQGILTRRAVRDNEESSRSASNQIWRAIDNLNWQARSTGESTDAARNAITQARDQFRQDERPYIWITHRPGGNDLEQPILFAFPGENAGSGHVIWTWFYTNFGKSPAYDTAFLANWTLPET